MKNNNNKIIYVFVTIGLILLIVGVSFAAFNMPFLGDNNTISTGTILLNYNEPDSDFLITDVTSLEDSVAKTSEQYFSFNINASATGIINIGYLIYLKIDATNSNVPNSAIKTHLASVAATDSLISSETQVVAPTLISNLVPINVNTQSYSASSNDIQLYTNYFPFNNNSNLQTHYYRLRIWVNKTYYDNNNTFVQTGTGPNDTVHQITTTRIYYKLTLNVFGIDGIPTPIVAP